MTVRVGVRCICVAAAVVPAVARGDVIDFDHAADGTTAYTASHFFSDAKLLTTLYASTMGVTFSGYKPGYGGRIVAANTNGFGVLPSSSPNVLAFNPGVPAYNAYGPETISFSQPWKSVSMQVAGGDGQCVFTMTAYDANKNVLATSSVTTQAFAPLLVQADGIRSVTIACTGTAARPTPDQYVFDDLTYTATPEPCTPILLVAALAGGLLPRRRAAQVSVVS